MSRLLLLLCVLPLLLILPGCNQNLNFKIQFHRNDGLAIGAPVVLKEQVVGEITEVEPMANGGVLVGVSIKQVHLASATEDSRFYIIDDPDHPSEKRVEIVQIRPGGKPITAGTIVQGSSNRILDWFPLRDIVKEFGNLLQDLRGQIERFSKEIETLPDSTQASELRTEWLKLMEEIKRAQDNSEESIKQEVLPKLQQEMENLRKRLEELRQAPSHKPSPLET